MGGRILVQAATLLLVAAYAYGHSISRERRQTEPEDGAVRLVGGLVATEGRVEVYHDGQWGTVCDDWWDASEATVVCNYLGYSGGVALYKAAYGPGTGPIFLDTIDCVGTEDNLGQCEHAPWGQHDCSHNEDSSVICDDAE